MGKDDVDVERRRFLTGFFGRFREGFDAGAPVAVSSAAAAKLKAANEAFSRGEFEPASGQYREFLQAESGNHEARLRLGICRYKQGKHVQAKVEFERVLRERKGKDNDAALYLGLTLTAAGRPEKAVAVWKLYCNPQAVHTQRELNLQLALLESGEVSPPEEIVAAVERAMGMDKVLG